MSFFDNNINNFIIGSEEGEIYLADRHGTKGEIQRSVEGKIKFFEKQKIYSCSW